MKRFLLIALCLIAGCHQKERPAPTVRLNDPLDGCKLPEIKELTDSRKLSEGMLRDAVDCLEKKVDSIFKQVHGGREEELSLEELRRLYRDHLVDLPLDEDAKWNTLGIVLPLLHPDGKPAIAKSALKRTFAWARRAIPYAMEVSRTKSQSAHLLYNTELFDLLEGLSDLISPKFRLGLRQAQDTTIELCRLAKGGCRDEASMRGQLEALWILKAAALEDTDAQGVRGDISGAAIRELVRTAIYSAREGNVTYEWGRHNFHPRWVPSGLPDEWRRVARVWKDYFTGHRFAAIDAAELTLAVKRLDPRGGLAGLTADLVRISQRLSPPERVQPGLHPVAFASFLDAAETVARDLVASAPAFAACPDGKTWCEISAREALAHPRLSRVALKGRMQYPYSDKELTGKRLDVMRFSWSSAMSRFLDRALIGKVFEAFSHGKDKIALTGTYDEDLEDVLDLAFTFLRFAAVESGKKTEKEERVPSLVMVKPGPLTRVMGLIGDEWMPDGNHDGSLDADEFYSVVKVYGDIHDQANYLAYGMNVRRYVRASDVGEQNIFRRREYVEAIGSRFNTDYPYLAPAMKSLPKEMLDSLMHAIVPLSKSRPIEAYVDGTMPGPKEILTNYVDPGASIGPVAIVNVLDRLMIRCDRDEDGLLDWDELDCAMPLVLEGGLQTVSSALLDLDPGVHDGAKLLLSFLKMKGVPLTLAKLLAVNGSVKEFNLDKEVKGLHEWVDRDLEADWAHIARFIGAPPEKSQLPFWIFEAKRRFGECDTSPKDGKLRGPKELDCFANVVVRQVGETLTQLILQGASKEGIAAFESVAQSEALRLGLKLATQGDRALSVSFKGIPLVAGPKKILGLLEEIIRRGVPLWQTPR